MGEIAVHKYINGPPNIKGIFNQKTRLDYSYRHAKSLGALEFSHSG